MASHTEYELKHILNVGQDHPKIEEAQKVESIFYTALIEQYYNVKLAWALGRVYLEERSVSEKDRQPVKALLPATPQQALLIRNTTMKAANDLGIRLSGESWMVLNVREVHDDAKEEAVAMNYPKGFPEPRGSAPKRLKPKWDQVTNELMSWLNKLSGDPGLGNVLCRLITDACNEDDAASIRFWHPMTQLEYLFETSWDPLPDRKSLSQSKTSVGPGGRTVVHIADDMVSELQSSLGLPLPCTPIHADDRSEQTMTPEGLSAAPSEKTTGMIRYYLTLMIPPASEDANTQAAVGVVPDMTTLSIQDGQNL